MLPILIVMGQYNLFCFSDNQKIYCMFCNSFLHARKPNGVAISGFG